MFTKAEELLSVVVDTAVDGVILIDAKGIILVFNPACERLFGYSAGMVIGQNVKVLMPAPFHAEHDSYLSNYHRTGERKIIGIGREVVGRRMDGTTFPMELAVGEATREGEKLFVGTIHDITERKQAEEQRRLFIEQLTASNEERGHFSYVASHDLQEHLRMVLSFNTLLLEEYGPKLDSQGREYLTLSLNAARHMRELVADLLEYTRLGSDQERERPFDASAEMDLVLESLEALIHDSGAEIDVDPLPFLFGNPVRFRRLLQNLMGNAIKYVPPQVSPRLRITVHHDGDFWKFVVSDNGIGIDRLYFKKIFEPFQRLHGKAQYSGTGLGLTICKKIVAGFGGDIWVESEPGTGSNFCFTVKKSRLAA